MADEPKPAEEPVDFKDGSGIEDPSPDSGGRMSAVDAIPDAEVIDEPVEARAAARMDAEPPPRPEPAPVAAPPAAPAPPPRRRSGAFFGFVVGGALAAAGGFALARYLPDGWPIPDTTALTSQLEQQAATLADLRTQVEALGSRETADVGAEIGKLRSDIEARIAALPPAPDAAGLAAEARSAAEGAVAALEARIAELESRPAAPAAAAAGAAAGRAGVDGVATAALAALTAEVEAIKADLAARGGAAAGASDELKALAEEAQAQITAATAEAEKLKSEAEAAGRAALARAALGRIKASLDGGEPFSSAVADLTDTGHEVPAALADTAATGIPSLIALQQSYPDAARAALDAALRADLGESWTDRAAAFLRTQTGARSLTPMEGDDPDAILSRAEAALDGGQLTAALSELSALPEAAKPPMATWIATAERREAATAAIAALSTALDAE